MLKIDENCIKCYTKAGIYLNEVIVNVLHIKRNKGKAVVLC